LHEHPPRQQIPRVKTTGVLNAQVTLVINMADVKSDLVDVA
jgi:hypothetical protein